METTARALSASFVRAREKMDSCCLGRGGGWACMYTWLDGGLLFLCAGKAPLPCFALAERVGSFVAHDEQQRRRCGLETWKKKEVSKCDQNFVKPRSHWLINHAEDRLRTVSGARSFLVWRSRHMLVTQNLPAHMFEAYMKRFERP